jgi:hypothetical protein
LLCAGIFLHGLVKRDSPESPHMTQDGHIALPLDVLSNLHHKAQRAPSPSPSQKTKSALID